MLRAVDFYVRIKMLTPLHRQNAFIINLKRDYKKNFHHKVFVQRLITIDY
jgi:hypothetical protein